MGQPIRFIGVTGPAVAGKDTVAQIICELFGAENLSTGDVLRALVRYTYRKPADYMPVREEQFTIGTFVREEIDPAFTVKVCMKQAEILNIPRAVISGMRSLPEAQAIQAQGGIVVGVTADPQVRYDRIHARARDAETSQAFDDFLKRDALENDGINGNGINAILAHADVLIKNNTDDLDELRAQVRDKLSALLG
jgi:dephospho-CoA kinase